MTTHRTFFSCLLLIGFLVTVLFNQVSAQTSRSLRVQQSVAARGQNQNVVVEMEPVGNENAVGFSLNFDADQLRFVSASTVGAASGAALNINNSLAHAGKIGIAFALPGGQKLSAGKQPVALVTFAVIAAENVTNTFLSFGDQPIPREVVDVSANAVAANFSGAMLTFAQPMAAVSAASFSSARLAPDSIATAFGGRLATKTQAAGSLPLPTSLTGASLNVKDSLGVDRSAQLFFVSPTQVNFLVPAGTANGMASIIAVSSDNTLSVTNMEINNVAPSLFSADATGRGLAVAVVQRVKANGTTSFESIARFDTTQGKFAPIPIDLSQPTDQVFLVLFSTGVRYRSNLNGVNAKFGGTDVPVLFAGAAPDFIGLDQINLRLPQNLAGRGLVNIALTVDGQTANVVTVSIK
ncbi:MAG: hypothetical protein SF097_01230 [Acidobacteriota bacterium]|nr:hypothetical protein [Acidobacteriota bacterium]